MANKPLTAEWLGWVQLNLARGCSAIELRQILAKNGFSAAAISQAFEAAVTRRESANVGARFVDGAQRHPSDKVELYTVENFLTPLECKRLVELVVAKLRRSTISTPPGGESDQTFRTSRTCDLVDGNPIVTDLDSKISKCIGIDLTLAEPTQGQRYEVGNQFKTHTDFFKSYELGKFATETLGQRSWTFMVYLDEPVAGGETIFPDVDLSIRPRTGMAVAWNNLLPSGAPNEATKHQGSPIRFGHKTVITKWFRIPKLRRETLAS
jgi:prolyl 4-hydroxylase